MESCTKENEIEKTIPSFMERGFTKLTDRWADRLPKRFSPNQITAVGLIMGLLGAVCFALGGLDRRFLLGAILGVSGHMIADNFDGFVARKWNKTSRVGAFYDITSDILVCTACMIGITLSGYADYRIALFAVPLYGIYGVIALHSIFLTNVFPFPRLGPFELHAMLVLVAVLNFAFGAIPIVLGGISVSLVDIIFLGGVLIEIVEFVELSVKLVRTLNRG